MGCFLLLPMFSTSDILFKSRSKCLCKFCICKLGVEYK